MRILALETTEAIASVAALDGGFVLAETPLTSGGRSAQTVAPGINALLRQVGWRPSDVELVAVTAGPGSFTGLRVGVTTAKVFAFAVGAEVLGIDTLSTIAGRAPPDCAVVAVCVDAQRGDVVGQLFRRLDGGVLTAASPATLAPAANWLADLPAGTVVTGPALRRFRHLLAPSIAALPEELWPPTARSVGELADRLYREGRRGDLLSLLPHYSRPSAAEERRKLAGNN
ncbi:MAG: tRNA (adenosine(37)-N6)-threonylcarbamoyltransferase complex dimerization subunit type 1 TsaB [Planctomycetota bacterium]